MSGGATLLGEFRSSAKRDGDMFQGRKVAGLSGTLPPFTAQTSKYQLSHFCGLIFQSKSVAEIENIITAKRPAHTAPLP